MCISYHIIPYHTIQPIHSPCTAHSQPIRMHITTTSQQNHTPSWRSHYRGNEQQEASYYKSTKEYVPYVNYTCYIPKLFGILDNRNGTILETQKLIEIPSQLLLQNTINTTAIVRRSTGRCIDRKKYRETFKSNVLYVNLSATLNFCRCVCCFELLFCGWM